MALKYNLKLGHVYIDKTGADEAIVDFEIFDDAGVGKVGMRHTESLAFPLVPADWPLSKANLKTKAETAITDEYPGATAE